MSSSFAWLIIALIVLGVLNKSRWLNGGGVPNVVARPLLTSREVAFWRLLRDVAAPMHVAPQVAMNALLNAGPGMDAARRRGTRNKFDRKVVDFALVDDSGVVRLLVELDDRTHRGDRDSARDRMTERAGYTTLRVTGQDARSASRLSIALGDALGS